MLIMMTIRYYSERCWNQIPKKINLKIYRFGHLRNSPSSLQVFINKFACRVVFYYIFNEDLNEDEAKNMCISNIISRIK